MINKTMMNITTKYRSVIILYTYMNLVKIKG